MTANAVNLTDAIFHNEEAARAHFEVCRWPNGPECPHCGVVSEATLVQGKSHRPGMYQCNACREPFTVKVGTVMEASHLPYTKWAMAFHLMAASKKGVSAHQLHRMLGITYKTAWFLEHRIREAMRDVPGDKLGGPGTVVEADETYVGGKARKGAGNGVKTRMDRHTPVAVLVERGKGGRARATVVSHPLGGVLKRNIFANVARGSEVHTDQHKAYRGVGKLIGGEHKSVNHWVEYARDGVHSNTAESWNALLKRSIVGAFHHVSPEHLARYCDEVSFRWDRREITDAERAVEAIKGGAGKRLTYRQPNRAE